jgi:hydrogenase maturation protease
MKTLIIGLGNPLLGDDGVGWKIAQEVEKEIDLIPARLSPGEAGEITVECLALSGLSLMEQMIDYQNVILIDSLNTGKNAQGEVIALTLRELPDLTYGHSASAHDASLNTALKMGRDMGLQLPDDENILVVAVEAAHVYEFTEQLSPEVAQAVPKAVETVINHLKRDRTETR